MGTIALSIPQVGQPNATEAPKIAADLTTLQTVINGNVDTANLTAAVSASAGVNATATVKGVTVNAGPGTRTNVAYGALNDAADQVTGIVLPANALLVVRYQATWQESVSGAARAAIFIGANQQKVALGTAPVTIAAATNSGAPAVPFPLATNPYGLASSNGSSAVYSGDVTTGQAVGITGGLAHDESGSIVAPLISAGPCEIFGLPAGTYTVSVQFKASSGGVTAFNRRLWVQALSFA